MKIGNTSPRWKWYHGVLLFLGMQIVSAVATESVKKQQEVSQKDRAFYKRLKQPRFAPPGYVFGPVWLINIVLDIVGMLHVSKQKPSAYRTAYLGCKTLATLIYCSFGAVYFGLRSPIGAAMLTVADLGVNLTSLTLALKSGDRKAAWLHMTLIPWLALASVTSVCMALWNRDPFFKQPVTFTPPAAVLKERKSAEAAS